MKNLFRIFAIVLLISIFSSVLISCNNGTPNEDDEDETKINIDGYTIVRPDAAITKVAKMTAILKSNILEKTASELSVITDYDSELEYEILIGNTNRKESTDALNELKKENEEEAFIIKFFEKKIVIAGLCDDDTIIGVKHFINEYVAKSEEEKTITAAVGDTLSQKTGELLYLSDKGEILVRETLSTVFDPKKGTEKAAYGKIIKIEHGEKKGTLLATKETSGAMDDRYPIYESTDDGKSWKEISRVTDTYNQYPVLGYQPYLYELPADVGAYKKGTIMIAFCTRISGVRTAMTVAASTDSGYNWQTIGNVEIGGSYNNGGWSSEGLWEPILLYEEETKRLYCFYSDELSTEHNQRLVYKYTTDLVTWSDKYECVALEQADLRPGMIMITKMGNGKYALVYELVNSGSMLSAQINIKFADRLDSWDAAEKGSVIETADGYSMATAPAIAWTPDGGECGTLLVTAKYNIKNSAKTICDFFMSFDYGETFVMVSNPIPNKTCRYIEPGYSPGLFASSDGAIYYVNDRESYDDSLCAKLMFAKLKVY